MQTAGDQDWLTSRLKRHLGELLRLATPVIGSRAGILVLMTVDLAYLGRAGADQTAFYSLGSSPFVILMVIGIGLMMGTMVTVSHAFGEENYIECGAIWRRSLPWALICGVFLTLLLIPVEDFFLLTGQNPGLAKGAAGVSFMMSLSLAPTLIYVTSAFFLEALRRPLPVLFAIGLANLLNFALNPIMVFGLGPIPEMGAEGAALATSIARTAMAVFLVLYCWYLKDHRTFGIRRPLGFGWWRQFATQRKYGYATGMSHGFESLGFGVMHIYAGWLGINSSAVFGMGMNLTALLFMAALGLANATSVRVGIAYGRRDLPDRELAGWVGTGVTFALMLVFSAILTLQPEWVALSYTNDPALVAMLITAVYIVGFVVICDGCQIVLSHAIRAAADPWTPTVLNFAAYFVVQIPLGYFLAIHMDHGVAGLFEAMLIGSVFSCAILGIRWLQLNRKDIKLSRALV